MRRLALHGEQFLLVDVLLARLVPLSDELCRSVGLTVERDLDLDDMVCSVAR